MTVHDRINVIAVLKSDTQVSQQFSFVHDRINVIAVLKSDTFSAIFILICSFYFYSIVHLINNY